MSDREKICPKCNRVMEVGFVADASYGMILQSSWTPGIPERRRFFGGVKWQQRDSRPITTYRCAGCGFIESYTES